MSGRLVRLVALVALVAAVACGDQAAQQAGEGDPDVDRGERLFAANCAVCHGSVGDGTTSGPPLVHEIYEPGHHSDESFQVAVARGVRAHHWDFGDMPAVAGLDRDDVADITAYVRELQREAGVID